MTLGLGCRKKNDLSLGDVLVERGGFTLGASALACESPLAMTVDPSNPHDSLVKQLLAGPARAAAVLQTLLPPEIACAVDWSSLRHEPGEMPTKGRASTHTDLVFRARLADPAHPVEVSST